MYKDRDTRQSDPDAIIETYQFNLGQDFLGSQSSNDIIKNINLNKAYSTIKQLAIAESEKEEVNNQTLAWFADVEDLL